MGVPLDRDGGVGPERDLGRRSSPEAVKRARIILWKGHCSRARAFHRAADRAASRANIPGIRVIVHPGGAVGRRPGGRRSGLDRIHHQDGQGEPGRLDLGGGHRNPPGEPPGAPGGARPHRPVARPVRLSLLDDVPRVAEPPAVGARGAGRRRGSQPDRRPRRTRSTGPGSRSIGCSSIRNVRIAQVFRPDLCYISLLAVDDDKEDRRWLIRFRLFRIRPTRSNRTSTR